MKIDIKNSNKKLLIVLMALLGLGIGFTAAYYQPQSNGSAAANATVMAKTTDVLSFSKGNPISITMTQQNFGRNGNNLTSTSTVMASLLANNDTNSASNTYNVYFNITGNSFHYTTAPTNTPELILTVTNPSGTPVTSITGLTYTTVNGVSGFDITEKKGLIQIANNYSITSNSGTTATNQTWTITVTLVNLDTNQQANTNKRFSGQAIIQKDAVTTAMMDTGQNVNAKMKTLASIENSSGAASYDMQDSYIVEIKRDSTLPSGFTPTSDNTISVSGTPVYIWFEMDIIDAFMGDYNNDGYVNVIDKQRMSDLIRGDVTPTEVDYILFDYNKDRVFNVMDNTYFNNILKGDISPKVYVHTYDEGSDPYYSSSSGPIGSIHYYSEADIIYLNANSSYLFSYFENLANINDLAYVNTSYVTNMNHLFDNCFNLSSIAAISNWDVSSVTNMGSIFFNNFNLLSIDALSNWNVSSVTDMSRLFTWCGNLTSLLPISNWDVSSVTDMSYMFYGVNNIASIAPLANWDVSSVTTMNALFYQCSSLTNLVGLENWDVSSVTDMADMFGNCSGLTTLTPLANWDVSSVTTMGAMFFYSNVANIDALANWDVSSVTSMRYMFGGCNISNLDALANWDVSSVTNMQYMFYSCIYLTDASAINDWNITHVLYTNNSENNNNFWYMFIYSNNVHPTFSKRSGTWDANGSFIPSA